MLVTIGAITLDVDAAATRRFYETSNGYLTCTCDGCRNFPLAVSHMPAALLDVLHQLGIDPLKPAEQWVNCATPDGKAALYGGFYHVCGRIVNSADHWMTPDVTLFVREDCSLLSPDFPRPCFEVEFCCQLPWLLETPSTESYPSP